MTLTGLELSAEKTKDDIVQTGNDLHKQNDIGRSLSKSYLITDKQLKSALNIMANLPYRICANVISELNSIPELEDYMLKEDTPIVKYGSTKAFSALTKDNFSISEFEIQEILNELAYQPEDKQRYVMKVLNGLKQI